jgi:hypothetical protein
MPDFHHSEITCRKVSPPNRSDVRFQEARTQILVPRLCGGADG